MKKLLATAAVIAASFLPINSPVEATSFYCTTSGHTSTCHKSDSISNYQFNHQDRCRSASGDFTVYGPVWKTLFVFDTSASGPGCPAKTSLLYHGGIIR